MNAPREAASPPRSRSSARADRRLKVAAALAGLTPLIVSATLFALLAHISLPLLFAGAIPAEFGALFWGTLKAAVFAMIFGAPIAVFAAIFTSEMVDRPTRARIRPVMEIFAGIPTVVLGALAVLVVAPLLDRFLATFLCLAATVPFCLLIASKLRFNRRSITRDARRLSGIAAALLAASGIAAVLGPKLEQLLFAGDLKVWLAHSSAGGEASDPTGGWLLLLLPVCAAAVFWQTGINHGAARTMFGIAATLALAAAGAFTLTHLGFDPRGSMLGPYVPDNAFIAGLLLGFAIVPTIFTLSEDALRTVPDRLRSASAAAGAAPWQTARRIVVPTAASGILSALLIGFGRAVGETMIVLAAAGNTPLLSWNPFEGLRAMTAHLALDLPGTAAGSPTYQMLFFVAFALFLTTSAIQIAAEIAREKFRAQTRRL